MSHTIAPLAAPTATTTAPRASGASAPRRWLRSVWSVTVGVIGMIVGLAPHVFHHAGPLVGAALVSGAGGTTLFGAVGLVASLPILLRLRRRFGNWRAPAIGLGVFAVMFSLSTFVIGPVISSADANGAPVPASDHSTHH
jgi:hypothetical protein